MSDKPRSKALAKYVVAAVAAILIIGVAVTTVMIKAKRKDVIVIQANKNSETPESAQEDTSRAVKEKTKTDSSSEPKTTISAVKQETSAVKEAAVTIKVEFPVDINKAGLKELCAIEGVGDSTAQRILDYRNSVGVIRSMRQLLNIDGIGEKTLKKLEVYLYVSDSDKAAVTSTASSKQKPKTTATKKTTAEFVYKQVNINKADAQQIAQSLNLSPETAQQVVDMRIKIGGYTAKTEILLCTGISQNDYLKLQDYIQI